MSFSPALDFYSCCLAPGICLTCLLSPHQLKCIPSGSHSLAPEDAGSLLLGLPQQSTFLISAHMKSCVQSLPHPGTKTPRVRSTLLHCHSPARSGVDAQYVVRADACMRQTVQTAQQLEGEDLKTTAGSLL